jgi:hypothetical protein
MVLLYLSRKYTRALTDEIFFCQGATSLGFGEESAGDLSAGPGGGGGGGFRRFCPGPRRQELPGVWVVGEGEELKVVTVW